MNKSELFTELYKRYGAVTRARGPFFYTKKGVRVTDLYQEAGRAILGWEGGSAFTMFKNVLSRGQTGSFICEDWDIIPKSSFNLCRQKAISKINKTASFMAFGSDIDPEAIEIAKINAKRAGISSRINFEIKSIKDFSLEKEENMIILCNPPYGERMLEIKEAQNIYKTMGEKFDLKDNNSYYIISPDENFEKIYGSKANKRRKLYNGMIKCQLYMYNNHIR